MRDGLSGFGAEERKSDFYEIWGGKIYFFFSNLKLRPESSMMKKRLLPTSQTTWFNQRLSPAMEWSPHDPGRPSNHAAGHPASAKQRPREPTAGRVSGGTSLARSASLPSQRAPTARQHPIHAPRTGEEGLPPFGQAPTTGAARSHVAWRCDGGAVASSRSRERRHAKDATYAGSRGSFFCRFAAVCSGSGNPAATDGRWAMAWGIPSRG